MPTKMQQHNQVFVIQVTNEAPGSKISPLALPPTDTIDSPTLPSEVKYSAKLVRGLGWAHVFLGFVLFLLGVLGTWVEPETCWAGAGVWTGLSAMLCGLCGLVAHCFWYKNFSIKAFLVTSVVCVVLSVLAIVLTIYAITNRYKHFQALLDQKDEYPWFQPYDLNKEHRQTMNISANLLVGLFLEVALALWSSRVGWRGVQTPEFSASKRDSEAPDQQTVAPLPPHPGQQVPLAALYQLLQTHPDMLGNKSIDGSLLPPWVSGSLGDHGSHHSMDYQERVSRFLSHGIEDQNTQGRPLSALQSDPRDSASASTLSGGRSSPADTLPLPPPDQTHSGQQIQEIIEKKIQERDSSDERKVKQTHIDVTLNDASSEKGIKETHIDDIRNTYTSDNKTAKYTHIEATANGDVDGMKKVKCTHVDALPDIDIKKSKHAPVEPLLQKENTRPQDMIKQTQNNVLRNPDTVNEQKIRQSNSDSQKVAGTDSVMKQKPKHTRSRRGSDGDVFKIGTGSDTDTFKSKISSDTETFRNRINSDTEAFRNRINSDTEAFRNRKVNNTEGFRSRRGSDVDTLRSRKGSERKPKAPAPKIRKEDTSKSSETNKSSAEDSIKLKDIDNNGKENGETHNEPVVDKTSIERGNEKYKKQQDSEERKSLDTVNGERENEEKREPQRDKSPVLVEPSTEANPKKHKILKEESHESEKMTKEKKRKEKRERKREMSPYNEENHKKEKHSSEKKHKERKSERRKEQSLDRNDDGKRYNEEKQKNDTSELHEVKNEKQHKERSTVNTEKEKEKSHKDHQKERKREESPVIDTLSDGRDKDEERDEEKLKAEDTNHEKKRKEEKDYTTIEQNRYKDEKKEMDNTKMSDREKPQESENKTERNISEKEDLLETKKEYVSKTKTKSITEITGDKARTKSITEITYTDISGDYEGTAEKHKKRSKRETDRETDSTAESKSTYKNDREERREKREKKERKEHKEKRHKDKRRDRSEERNDTKDEQPLSLPSSLSPPPEFHDK